MLPDSLTTTAGTWTKIQAGSINDQPTIYKMTTSSLKPELTIKHSQPAPTSKTGVVKHLIQIRVHLTDVNADPIDEFTTLNMTVMTPVDSVNGLVGEVWALEALLETVGAISGTDIIKSANALKILASEN